MPAIIPSDFFKTPRTLTELKQEVISKFVANWLTIQQPDLELPIVFADLLATDDNDTIVSAGLMPTIHKVSALHQRVSIVTADVNDQTTSSSPGFEYLAHTPVAVTHVLTKIVLSESWPTLLVADPFSDKAIQELFSQTLFNHTPDLLLFINPETIRKSVNAKKVNPVITQLFGNRLDTIKGLCGKEKSKVKQTDFIIEQFTELLKSMHYNTRDFKVNQPDQNAPGYYLLFASQGAVPYKLFKELVLNYTDHQQDGVPLFETNSKVQPQLTLFPEAPKYSILKLADQLALMESKYKYKPITTIANDHSIGTNYIPDNYLAAFELLRTQGIIEILNPKTLQPIRKPLPGAVVKYKKLL